jgi:hypothetical protein
MAHSTTQAGFPEIQDSALTDLTTVLGVGVRSAAGYPGRIQERWRSESTESILGACQLDRALQAETRVGETSQQPSPTLPQYRTTQAPDLNPFVQPVLR